ncbi:carbon-nitrogen hydrolase [Nadsonia fulvescens var. elongata DSM 6958]|uniref:Carbon-nitrogen hydrolase n=1 Tax=Nadsonia fulvescens var. elongata DSM 6958 TaxID=857566 RepID=A0A1E3PH39_9ASCO|nr:carbon-nitrogen hydrolase [Nadsonia fulvescens var. elongata DSM 6958]
MSLAQKLKIALLQVGATADKAANLALVKAKVTEAAANGAKLVVLPECFNSPYAVTAFPKYAESIPEGETTQFLSQLAQDTKTFIIGGSIPENADGKIYNTNISFNPRGELIGKHRKVHLFDINVPGKIRFIESEVLSPGNKATVIDIEGYGKVGVGICYDIRFPELASIAGRKGAFAMIYPGAFNLTTGPLHWSLLGRARSNDNQLYVLMCGPARDMTSGYHAWGHSLVADPLGQIITEADEKETIVYAELDPELIENTRATIPITTQRMFGVYDDVAATGKCSAL